MASGPNTSWQIDGEKLETVIINKTGLEHGHGTIDWLKTGRGVQQGCISVTLLI